MIDESNESVACTIARWFWADVITPLAWRVRVWFA